jgi:hypothetical protein
MGQAILPAGAFETALAAPAKSRLQPGLAAPQGVSGSMNGQIKGPGYKDVVTL